MPLITSIFFSVSAARRSLSRRRPDAFRAAITAGESGISLLVGLKLSCRRITAGAAENVILCISISIIYSVVFYYRAGKESTGIER